jgi:hypothetical protein
MKFEHAELFYKCIEKWGIEPQLRMAFEEMAELTIEICKHSRGSQNRYEVLDEITDVSIMLDQLKVLFGFSENEIAEQLDFKINRLKERLEK